MTECADMDWRPMAHALRLVAAERRRQIEKWGGPDGDGIENPYTSNYVRLRVLAEEFGEVAEAMGRPEDGNGKRDLQTELVQVAAVAVAWLEALAGPGHVVDVPVSASEPNRPKAGR